MECADILQRGLEIQCILIFLAKNFKEGNKTKQLLEETLLLSPVELNLASETDEGNQDAEDMAELWSDIISPDVNLKIKSEPLSKRAILGDMEKSIMGKELANCHWN